MKKITLWTIGLLVGTIQATAGFNPNDTESRIVETTAEENVPVQCQRVKPSGFSDGVKQALRIPLEYNTFATQLHSSEMLMASSPWQPDPSCRVAYDDLQAIVSSMEKNMEGTALSLNDTILHTTGKSTKCKDAVQTIVNLNQEIHAILRKLRSSGLTKEELKRLENSYQEKLRDFTEKMEFVKKQAEQDVREQVDKTLQKMLGIVKELMQGLQDAQHGVDEMKRTLLIENIKMRRFNEAFEYFKQLKNPEKLPEFMKEAYESTASIYQITEFLARLPIIQQMKGIQLIVDVTVDRPDDPTVIIIDDFLRQQRKTTTNKDDGDAVDNLMFKIEASVAVVLDQFSEQIKSGDHENVKSFVRFNPGKLRNYFFRILETARKRHSNDPNLLETFLNFCKTLRTLEWNACGLNQLPLSLINEFYEDTQVTFTSVLRLIDGIKEDEKALREKSNIISRLPEVLQLFAYGGACIMPSSSTGSYLTKGNDFDKDRMHVIAVDGAVQKWGIKLQSDSIVIANMHMSHYSYLVLYAPSDHISPDPDFRPVFLWKSGYDNNGQSDWIVEKANWAKKELYLRNKRFNEYLTLGKRLCYSSGCSDKNHFVATDKSGKKSDRALWIFTKCP